MKRNDTQEKGLFVQVNKRLLIWSMVIQVLFISVSICTLMRDDMAMWKVYFALIGGIVFLFMLILTVYNFIKLNKNTKNNN